MTINYHNVDIVIEKLYRQLPRGYFLGYISESSKIEHNEMGSIQRFLEHENIIEDWGSNGMTILTNLGEVIYKHYGGIEAYINELEKNREKEIFIEKKKNEKLLLDLKISKWQVKSFWYVFTIGLLGGLFSIYSIIREITDKPLEQKVEDILRKRESLQQQKSEVSIDQTHNKAETETINDSISDTKKTIVFE